MKKLPVLTLTFLLTFFLISHLSSLISPAFAQTIKAVKGDFAVSASVQPQASDFQFAFTSDAPHTVYQEQTITYEISYGASSSAAINSTNTVVVDFMHDHAPDGTHVMEYVVGSADKGYGDVEPIVDLKNRTITWTNMIIPAGTVDQKLRFKLKTNSYYSPDSSVNLTVQASLANQFAALPMQTVLHGYRFDKNKVIPGPTQPQPTARPVLPTATPTPVPLRIQQISFHTITDNQASLTVKTSKPAKLQLTYGTSPDTLSQTIQTDTHAVTHALSMIKLKPDTAYYFTIRATDAERKTVVSELYTFTTARLSDVPELTFNAVAITSKDIVILSEILKNPPPPFGIITQETNYLYTYTFTQQLPIVKMETVLKDLNGNEVQVVAMNETSVRTYVANLYTTKPDTYRVFVRLTDENGNLFEQETANIKVIRQLEILERGTAEPVGDARVLIKFYNTQTKQYELVSRERFGTQANPLFTQTSGTLDLLLPPGKYLVEVSAIGYDPQTETFTLGQGNGEHYPTIYLNRNLTNVTAIFQSIQDWLIDTTNILQRELQELLNSIRFFNSVAFTILLSFIGLGFLMFGLRSGISVRDIPPFFIFHLFVFSRKHKGAYLYGIIVDHLNNPIPQALIEVIDIKSGTVLTHTFSNKSGTFAIRNTFKQQMVKLVIAKEGYPETERIVETTSDTQIKIGLHRHTTKDKTIPQGIAHIVGELFEVTLLACLVTELLFLASFGIVKTLPFIILSIFNLLLWIFFQREKKIS